MSLIHQSDQDPYNRHLFNIQNDLTTMERLKLRVKKSTKELKSNLTQKSFYKKYLLKRIPIIKWLFLEYNLKKYLFGDLISGFTVGIMNIPQGMAYALLANLAPVNGLYISFFPVLIYAIFGTSRQLSIGSFAVVSILASDAILSLSNQYKDSLITQNMTSNSTDDLVIKYKVTVACSLAAFVGLIQIIMGLTGLGVITKLFSDSFISGYTCGSSIHVLTSQIKDLFGLTGLKNYDGSLKIPLLWINMLSKITTTNISALITTIICLAYLIIFKEFLNPRIKKRFKFEFPSELLLVIVTTLISYFFKLNSIYGLSIIKTIPRGLPVPDTPDISLWGTLFKNALIISIISFSINISLATLFAKKHGYEVDSTQELYAYGASNVFGSFFSCFPCAGSLSRSMVLDNAGGKSQLSAIIGSLVIIIVIIWLGPFFEPLPKACLASIIVVALKGLLFQLKDLVTLWKINKYEALTWLGTFLSVVLLDVDIGLLIGVVLSVLLIVVKDRNVDLRILVNYDDSYVDSKLLKKSANDIHQNVKVLKVQKNLYFINISSFIDEFSELSGFNHKKVSKIENEDNSGVEFEVVNSIQSQISCFMLDFSAVDYIDSTSVKAVLQLIEDNEKLDLHIFICSPQESFVKIINKMNLIEKFQSRLFLTVKDAFLYINSVKL